MFIDHLHETSLMSDQLNLIEGSALPRLEHLPLDSELWTNVHIRAATNSLFLVHAGAQ